MCYHSSRTHDRVTGLLQAYRDGSPDAVINPSIHRAPLGFPDRAVMCWFGNVVRERTLELVPVHNVPFEHGDHGIYVIEHNGIIRRDRDSFSTLLLAGSDNLEILHFVGGG